MAMGSCVSSSVFNCAAVRSNFHDLLAQTPAARDAVRSRVSGAMQHHGLVLLESSSRLGHLQLYRPQRAGRLAIDAFKLRMPLFGN